MENYELKELLSFEDELKNVEIIKEEELSPESTLIVAILHYNNEEKPWCEYEMIVPFIHFNGEDWIFTPFDWQDFYDETFAAEDVEDVEWRVNDTGVIGININGIPHLF